MNASSTVLILDRSAESRHVLRTLLERQGARAVETGAPDEAFHMAQVDPPDLIIVDLDNQPSFSPVDSHDFHSVLTRKDIPILVIGSQKQHRGQLPGHSLITKPYHYRDLLRRIEQLLDHAA